MGMQIKKYQAATLQKGIEQIRQDLGDGAIILQADPIPNAGFGRHGIEITAAIDRKDLPPRFSTRLPAREEEKLSVNQPKRSSWKEVLTKPFGKKTFTSTRQEPEKAQGEHKQKKEDKQVAQKKVDKVIKQAVQGSRTKPESIKNQDSSESMGSLYAMRTYVEPLKQEIDSLKKNLKERDKESQTRQPSTALIENELQSLRKTMSEFMQERKFENTALNTEVQKLIHFWQEKGMSSRQILAFLNQLERQGLEIEQIQQVDSLRPILAKEIKDQSPLASSKKRIVCLIGPTGVGKTTTIAKLAAFEKLQLKRKVALVTMDDFKIGGTDQLGHYARILEVPFFKSRSDLSLEDQIKHIEADTIFVDTFGVSSKNDEQISQLRKSLRFKDPELAALQEVHLALPVGIFSGDVESVLEGFGRVHPDYLLFTKWDESENWGGMLASMLESHIPVSYIGHGQEVPDDLSVFSKESFIETVTKLD